MADSTDPLAHATAGSSDAVTMLRPGCPVLLRDADTVQVGLSEPLAVRLPRRPEVVALLRALETGTTSPPPGATDALTRLRQAGLVVDRSDATIPGSAWAQFGSEAPRRQRHRRRHRVGIVEEGLGGTLLDDLLQEAALVRDDAAPTVVLVAASGTVRRGRIDPLLRAGVPHLVVTGHPRGFRVGPFVDPGLTACVRCVDAEEATRDPRLPLLLEQAADGVGVPAPDPLLTHLALAWAVRDLARWAEGERPSTWSATVAVDATRTPVLTPRLRHPHCGCAWDELLPVS